MIYFPGFEVKDEEWLKFALLYLDNLRPIVPVLPFSNNIYMSQSFIKIMNETDLINIYRPQYNEGLLASALACEEFERYLQSPGTYSVFLGRRREDHFIVDKWRNPRNQKYVLFQDKYSDAFHRFCIENQIATPCNDGMQISEDLAFVYMSFLADVIAKNSGLETITDIKKYSMILQKNNHDLAPSTEKNIKTACNNIEFNIPEDLKDIPLDIFISLRSQNNFNTHRKAYMDEIKKLITAKETIRLDYSLEEMLSRKKDFISICEKSFNMLATTTITTVSIMALADGVWGAAPLSLAVAYRNFRSLNDVIRNTPSIVNDFRNKHHARKYIATLKKITRFRY